MQGQEEDWEYFLTQLPPLQAAAYNLYKHRHSTLVNSFPDVFKVAVNKPGPFCSVHVLILAAFAGDYDRFWKGCDPYIL
jgi:hypothetical protein